MLDDKYITQVGRMLDETGGIPRPGDNMPQGYVDTTPKLGDESHTIRLGYQLDNTTGDLRIVHL